MNVECHLIAIVGGSGSGKTWLAKVLREAFPEESALITLDDFYRDQSHLIEEERSRVNFDHPKAVDWEELEECLVRAGSGGPFRTPVYNFTTHTRVGWSEWRAPARVILVDGLWLLRRARLRKRFDFSIYVACSEERRFAQRLARDCKERGRSEASVREQFFSMVAPMHRRFVEGQERWADFILRQPAGGAELGVLADRLRGVCFGGEGLESAGRGQG